MTDFPNRARYAVDWDDTCVRERDENGDVYWPHMGDWLPGAIEALRILSARGKTVIYSLRCHLYERDDLTPRSIDDVDDQVAAIEKMLREAELWDISVYPPDRGKPPAQFYIDDKGVHFAGDWQSTLLEVFDREAPRG